jgi:hypothetical protein
MSSSTFSQRRGGSEHSRSFDRSRGALNISRRTILTGGLSLFLPAILFVTALAPAETKAPAFVASKTAAAQCQTKLRILDDFAGRRKPGQTQTTRFTDEEINSHLALNLKPKYHASLKNLEVAFYENKMRAIADIDFDRLGSASTKLWPRLVGLVFSGIHTLAAEGQVIGQDRNAFFRLERARFDNSTLPKYLVEEVISAVGRKQRPPFDPMKPSRMPYEINRIEMHQGYIIVFQ